MASNGLDELFDEELKASASPAPKNQLDADFDAALTAEPRPLSPTDLRMHGSRDNATTPSNLPTPRGYATFDKSGKAIMPSPTQGETAIAHAANAADMNWGDELVAKGVAGLNAARRWLNGVPSEEGQFAKDETAALDSARRDLKEGRELYPGTASSTSMAGGFLPQTAAAIATGGASLTPKGQALMGAVSGAGTGTDLESRGKNAAIGMGLGAGLSKLAQLAPVATGVGLGALGTAGAVAGDKVGLKPADRWDLGFLGGAGLLGAGGTLAARLLGKGGAAAEQAAENATSEVSDRIKADDAAKAAALDKENDASKKAGVKLFDKAAERIAGEKEAENGIPQASKDFIDAEHKAALKQRGADEAAFNKATADVGKQKFKRLDEAINQLHNERAAAQGDEDKYVVQALQQSERPAAGGGVGAGPEQIAAFEASIPSKVQAKENAELGAALNRVATFRNSGKEVPAQLADYVDGLVTEYEKNTPGFLEQYFRSKGPKGLAAEYEKELLAQLADMKARRGGGAIDTSRDTVIGTPKAADLLAARKPPLAPKSLVPIEEQLKMARDYGIDTKAYDNEAMSNLESQRAMDIEKALGTAPLGPGEKPNYGALVGPDEREGIAKNLGLSYLQRSDEEQAALNAMKPKDRVYGPDTIAKTPTPPPPDTGAARPRNMGGGRAPPNLPSDVPIPWSGEGKPLPPEPSPEYKGWMTWDQLGKVPYEEPPAGKNPAADSERFLQYLQSKTQTPATEPDTQPWKWGAELAPTLEERAQQQIASTGPAIKQAAMSGAFGGAKNPLYLGGGAALGAAGGKGALGVAGGAAVGAVSGAASAVNRLAAADPAVRARIFGTVADTLNNIAGMEKYAGLFSGAANPEKVALAIQLLSKQEPRLAEIVSSVLNQQGRPRELSLSEEPSD